MKRSTTLVAGCALALLGATAARADCAADLALLSGGQGISKDGSLAPLSAPAPEAGAGAQSTGQSAGSSGAGETAAPAGTEANAGIAKDGETAPLGAGEDVAMSRQDAQAQQGGGETAQAGGDPGAGADPAALEEARSALAAGDEQACLTALERARGS